MSLPLEGTTPMPEDDTRPVTLRELRAITDGLDAREQSKESRLLQIKRDRFIGWVITTVLLSCTLGLAGYQYHSDRELRQNLYDNCTQAQSERWETAQFYRELADMSHDPSSDFTTLLRRQIVRLETPRDCAAKYL